MINTILFLFTNFIIVASVFAQTDSTNAATDSIPPDITPSRFTYSLNASFGLTFQNISKSDDETLTTQWLTNVDTRISYDDSTFGLASSLYLQYGQLHNGGLFPEKTQDNLIFSITPSLVILPSWNIRLFLETTAETQMKKGMVDNSDSYFLDPVFLYQTVFIGQKFATSSTDGTGEFALTYGVGYAIQQTITDKFVLKSNRNYIIGPNNPLSAVQSQVTLESGISAVFDLTMRKQIGEKLNLNASIKTVLLGKEETYQDLTKTRASSLILAGISYGLFSIDYTMRLLYDSNYSFRRQLEQSLVAGIRYSL
ncbi:MAG: hypothetical protein IPM69_04905 [Ignavibacteria bacterium]|nr:hypothetical protein [Ignavibacteria bacterium]